MAKGRSRGNREQKKPKSKKIAIAKDVPIHSLKDMAAQNAATQRKA